MINRDYCIQNCKGYQDIERCLCDSGFCQSYLNAQMSGIFKDAYFGKQFITKNGKLGLFYKCENVSAEMNKIYLNYWLILDDDHRYMLYGSKGKCKGYTIDSYDIDIVKSQELYNDDNINELADKCANEIIGEFNTLTKKADINKWHVFRDGVIKSYKEAQKYG